jgi:hypothetical protein
MTSIQTTSTQSPLSPEEAERLFVQFLQDHHQWLLRQSRARKSGLYTEGLRIEPPTAEQIAAAIKKGDEDR